MSIESEVAWAWRLRFWVGQGVRAVVMLGVAFVLACACVSVGRWLLGL